MAIHPLPPTAADIGPNWLTEVLHASGALPEAGRVSFWLSMCYTSKKMNSVSPEPQTTTIVHLVVLITENPAVLGFFFCQFRKHILTIRICRLPGQTAITLAGFGFGIDGEFKNFQEFILPGFDIS